MFEQKSILECLKELDTNLEQGLTESEAQRRLKEYGKNALETDGKKSIWKIFFSQINEPMIYILLAAAAISLLLGEIADAVIILIVVLLNAIIGTVQEAKAEKVLESLKKLSSPTATVKRDGILKEIKAEDVVLGDIMHLEAGRYVSADLRLVEAINLKIEESSLTGESLPVLKNANMVLKENTPIGDRLNLAYMSTSVVYGRGVGIVCGTGMSTEIGRIAELINKEEGEPTPLQKRLGDLGKLLGIVTIIISVVLFILAIIQKRDPLAMLITAISLAVAAIPEGLPAVVTIVLALGVQRMVKVNTIVRKLHSVETLGAVSVVCSDKTGTLTENKMTVTKVYYNFNTHDVEELDKQVLLNEASLLVTGMALCNDASIEGENRIGDPTEIALIDLAYEFKLKKDDLQKKYPRVDEIPFDSNRKMMTTVHLSNNKRVSYTKGALDQILNKTTGISINGIIKPISEKDIIRIQEAAALMAKGALRVLAFAYKEDVQMASEDNLIFVGFVGMIDPARKEAAPAVQSLKEAGIKTVMITGDHKDTALAIAKDLKIAYSEAECMSGEELNLMTQEELNSKVMDVSVYARVSPEHKVMIVKAFKSHDLIVAMTGDGVNDAPSLKAADIGISMGITGTDVAKGASDMTLSDDNFASIEKAVREGRGIYSNIKKSVLFLLSSNFGEVAIMFLGILLFFPVPLLPIHILWVNLITDSLPALALGADNIDDDIMKEKPRKSTENLFAHGGLKLTLFYGILIALISFAMFLSVPIQALINQNLPITITNLTQMFKDDPDRLILSRTLAFSTLAVCQLFHAFGMRNVKKSIFDPKIFGKNRLMFFSFIFGMLLQVAVTEVPFLVTFFKTSSLSINYWIVILSVALIPVTMHEIIFVLNYYREKRKKVKEY